MSSLKSEAVILLALGLPALAYSADEAAVTTTAEANTSKSSGMVAKTPDEGTVIISSPTEGSKLSGTSARIVFDVTAPGKKGDHVHVYADGEHIAQVRQLKGTYNVDKLAVGKHWLCVRVVDKGNTPVGIEKCVSVIVGDIPPMGY